jgi:hypothetical protein
MELRLLRILVILRILVRIGYLRNFGKMSDISGKPIVLRTMSFQNNGQTEIGLYYY